MLMSLFHTLTSTKSALPERSDLFLKPHEKSALWFHSTTIIFPHPDFTIIIPTKCHQLLVCSEVQIILWRVLPSLLFKRALNPITQKKILVLQHFNLSANFTWKTKQHSHFQPRRSRIVKIQEMSLDNIVHIDFNGIKLICGYKILSENYSNNKTASQLCIML